MSSYFLEGESFFVLNKLDEIIENKKVEFNPDKVFKTLSLINKVDYYVYFDPDKETIEKINHDNFIICFVDKNVDLRLDYIKKVKNQANYHCFEPIPTTDFVALKAIFPKIANSNFLPFKKGSLKYKGSKQSYEWFDLNLIADLYFYNDPEIYKSVCNSYFDIWKFSDGLWSGSLECVKQIPYINESNFEDYFNRIRETSKDYIEVIQSGAKNFWQHRKLIPNCIITNEYRFNKVKEKLDTIKPEAQLLALSYFDECLKNVRQGSNQKIELIKLFFNFKKNVLI